MRCEDVMKKDVVTSHSQTSIRAVAQIMRDHEIGFVPVVDESGRAIGAVTDRDLAIKAIAAKDVDLDGPVSSISSQGIVGCRAKDDLREAERLMAVRHVSRVVCLDAKGRPVGVISLSDVAESEEGTTASDTLRQVASRESHVTH